MNMVNREVKIRVQEVFGNTVQGEGVRVGKPSIFVRVTGCNFRCKQFGCKPGEVNTEIDAILENIDQYSRPEDFPLVTKGCDSYLASYPQFKQFSTDYTIEQLIEAIKDEAPERDVTNIDLVITGGEPLIAGTQKKLVQMFKMMNEDLAKMSSLTFENNGSQKLTSEMVDYLVNECPIRVIFSVSPKLACSGEPFEKTHVPEAIQSYNELCTLHPEKFEMYLKYVVSSEDDIREVQTSHQYLNFNNKDNIWLMPCGGTYEEYTSIMTEIAELACKYRYRFSPREHVILFRNVWRK